MDPQNPQPADPKPPIADGSPPVDLSKAKRKRGRPRKPAKAAAPGDSEKHSSTEQANAVFDASFLSESAVCLIEIADEVIARTLADRIAKAIPARLAEFVKLQQTVGLNDKDRQMVEMSVLAMAEKYQVLTRFGPELLLLAWGAQYSLRQARLFKFVRQMEAEIKKMTPEAKSAPVNGATSAVQETAAASRS